MYKSLGLTVCFSMLSLAITTSCAPVALPPGDVVGDDGDIAPGIAGKMGDPLPSATPEQLATFERGKSVFLKRFDLAEGLGPAFNVSACGACHERPAPGGSSGLYRNFFLAGRLTQDGAFLPSDSAGMAGGVLRVFSVDASDPLRPRIPADTTIFAQRNAISIFGVGLLAELSDEEILSREDPDDLDGDGISGRPNFDRGFVGRFGRKSQTVSLEGFIRGPLFNHLGVTTDPLTDDERSRLPVESSTRAVMKAVAGAKFSGKFGPHMQIAAPDGPSTDDDGVPGAEMTNEELFDLISFTMLLAGPELEEPTVQSNRGRLLFHEAKCSACHVARLNGPRGPLPVYSDLLLHDMGSELADGIVQGDASGSEFRTQPLWGISAVGPYLHDGRAETLREAILAHGGEGQASRNAFAGFSQQESQDVIEFLLSLGGRDQFTTGLLESDAGVPAVGEYGGPVSELGAEDLARFIRGREVFDRDFGYDTGVGGLEGADLTPRFNGDSCRACHFAPILGGGGPRDVNVMRHGIRNFDGSFDPPATTPNTILHKQTRIGTKPPEPEAGINVFEHRQPPHVFGLGLMDSISEETIRSNEDPNDDDRDGISGRAHVLADGRIGRLGWKAQVPSVAEFVRDAMAAEIGITLPPQDGLTFGITDDNDGVADPELSLAEVEDLGFFLSQLGPPPRQAAADAEQVAIGEELFTTLGCAKCHIPSLPGAMGDVPLYSDLLLHDILAVGTPGIEDGDASMTEFRTAPLWGLSQTAPYSHTGFADTIDEAIRLHDGESRDIRVMYTLLPPADKAALLAFLNTL